METKHLNPENIMQLGMAFWGSKTLLSAIELELFTLLAKGPLTLQEIISRCQLHPRGTRDFLDSLVSLGMLERNGRIYGNTAQTDYFLDKNKPSYIGGLFEMANLRLYPAWGNLTQGLKTGRPQNEVALEVSEEDNLFEALYMDPAKLKNFAQAMSGVSRSAALALAEKFPWKNYGSFMDVGCAQGMVPLIIAQAHPHLKGVGFDLPPVRPVFEEFIQGSRLDCRVKFTAGDFFKDPLPQSEVIIMGHILHDWGMGDKKMLLQKAYEALPNGGALIVYEALIDDDRKKNAFGLLMSLNMLLETKEGFDFTGQDCTGWMKEAGFKEVRVEPLVGPDSMVIGIK